MSVQLDILNAMLAAIGSSGISSTQGRHPGLLRANPILARINRSVQARGHWFNTDWGLVLTPTTEGEFVLPQATLKADTTEKRLPYVRRGRYLYDPKRHTSLITDVPSIAMDVVVQLDYDDLPQTAVDYIQARAVVEITRNSDMDQIGMLAHEKELKRANMAFETERLSQADYNLRDNPAYSRIIGGLRGRYGVGTSPTNLGG